MRDANIDHERDWLRDQINERAIVRARPGEAWPAPASFPGSCYLWVFQPRRVLFDPEFASRAADYLLKGALIELFDRRPFQLGAMEAGGVPLAMALQWMAAKHNRKLNVISVRQKQKPYGVRNQIEGVPNELPVMLIDDIVNSARTMRRGARIIHEEGLELYPVATGLLRRFDRGDGTGPSRYMALFDYGEFDLHWEDYQAARIGRSIPLLRQAEPGERGPMMPPIEIEGIDR